LSGPAPSLEEVRRRRGEIERLAARHGARGVRVFGSVARGEARPDSDLDVLVEMEQRGMLEQAGLQGDLEELLRCPVHVATTCGLRYARESTRKQIEREAIPL
jgi:predicted nucleotidyltransferase